jgi:hypothetical protein
MTLSASIVEFVPPNKTKLTDLPPLTRTVKVNPALLGGKS